MEGCGSPGKSRAGKLKNPPEGSGGSEFMPCDPQGVSDNALALCALACQFACPANRLCPLAGFLFRRLLEMLARFHLPEEAFALHLLLERAQGLLDIVIADNDLYYGTSPSGSVGFSRTRNFCDWRAVEPRKRGLYHGLPALAKP